MKTNKFKEGYLKALHDVYVSSKDMLAKAPDKKKRTAFQEGVVHCLDTFCKQANRIKIKKE